MVFDFYSSVSEDLVALPSSVFVEGGSSISKEVYSVRYLFLCPFIHHKFLLYTYFLNLIIQQCQINITLDES